MIINMAADLHLLHHLLQVFELLLSVFQPLLVLCLYF